MMSERGSGLVRQSDPGIGWRAVLGVFLAFVLIGGACVLWVVLMDTSVEPLAPTGAAAAAPTAGSQRAEAPTVDRLIEEASPAESLAAVHRRTLSEYEWVDRERRIARIPIEQAMQAVVRRSARGAGAAGEASEAGKGGEEGDGDTNGKRDQRGAVGEPPSGDREKTGENRSGESVRQEDYDQYPRE
jgi:hypothetical protein